MNGAIARSMGRLRWAVRQRGALGAVRMLVGRLLRRSPPAAKVHPFDVEHGVETSGLIEGGDLPGGHAHDVFSTAYFGVPPSRMRGVLERWRATADVLPVEQYAFLDVGCGKGRALLLASEMPFREVLGVELNPGLAATARRNVATWVAMARARCAMEVVCGDATEVAFPKGPLLVYLYNPFSGEVLRRLLEQFDDWAAGGERLEIVYLYPEWEQIFGEFPRFAKLWSGQIGLSPEDLDADEISAAEDPCDLYRWIGRAGSQGETVYRLS